MFGAPVKLTASRLDELGNCPLSFFLQYGLKARERKQAEFDAREFGTFLHYILEKTVGELTAEDSVRPLSQNESETMVERYMGPYLSDRMQDQENLSARQRYLYGRNRQEASQLLVELAQEFSQSEFRPCAFELQFGEGKSQGPLRVSGKLGEGRLDGTVDRADLWKGPQGDFLRIVDYKSGTKSFDYTDLAGGVGMQLLLYLFALEQSGISQQTEHPIPAGACIFRPNGKSNQRTGRSAEKRRMPSERREKSSPVALCWRRSQHWRPWKRGSRASIFPQNDKKAAWAAMPLPRNRCVCFPPMWKDAWEKLWIRFWTGSFLPSPFTGAEAIIPAAGAGSGMCAKRMKNSGRSTMFLRWIRKISGS